MKLDYDLKAYYDGYSHGYNAGLDTSGQRIPLLFTLAAVAVLFGLGWLVGHFT
jgi:hypothetical protein